MVVTMTRSHTGLSRPLRHAMASYPLKKGPSPPPPSDPEACSRKHHDPRFTGFAFWERRRRSWFWDMRPFPTRSNSTFVVKKRHAVLDQIAFKSAWSYWNHLLVPWLLQMWGLLMNLIIIASILHTNRLLIQISATEQLKLMKLRSRHAWLQPKVLVRTSKSISVRWVVSDTSKTSIGHTQRLER